MPNAYIEPQDLLTVIGLIVSGIVGLAIVAGIIYVYFRKSSTEVWKGLAEGRAAKIDEQKTEIEDYQVEIKENRKQRSECEERVNEFGKELLRMTARNGKLERGINDLRRQQGLPEIDFESPNAP